MHVPTARPYALQVEGIVFGVERDELRGPPATLTSTYVVLWDTEGKNRRGKSPLAVSCWQYKAPLQ